MQKLDAFGDRMSDKHCWDLCSDAYGLSWRINSDFNGPYAMTTLIVGAKYANALHEKGDDAGAINLYNNIGGDTQSEIKRYPYSHAFLYGRLGDCYYRLGNYDIAARQYAAALATLPTSNVGPDGWKVRSKTVAHADFAMLQSHLADCVRLPGIRRELYRFGEAGIRCRNHVCRCERFVETDSPLGIR